MNPRYLLGSMTRTSDLDSVPFDVEMLPRAQWAGGDFVTGRVVGDPTALYRLELASGRMMQVLEGDEVIGAFGTRAATLEGVGSWRDIEGLEMHALTSAGLFGAATSMSLLLPRLLRLTYGGHVVRAGKKVHLRDFVPAAPPAEFALPVVLLVGTSMNAGKTTTGRLVIHELKRLGLKVIGAKLTGAGRYRDILSFQDAGADYVFDFVDAGLPSTVVPEAEFRAALGNLLDRMMALDADVVVAEAGASPLEPYNGEVAIERLQEHICCTILCASDPYAVVGVQTAFGLQPDLVAGPAASTDSAIALVRKLSGLEALNIMRPESVSRLRDKVLAALPPGLVEGR